MMPTDDLKLRVLEAARRQPVPPRTDRLPSTVALAALAVLAMGAVVQWGPRLFGMVGGLAPAASRPAIAGTWIVGGTLAVAAISTWLALPARRSMLAPARGVLLAVTIGVPLLVGAWLVLWHGSYEGPPAGIGWRCFVMTALTAPWPFAALVYASRRVEPSHPGTTGAALGAVAGAWAAVMIALWCPLSAHAHVLVGHVAPVAALALAGAAFGARTFPRRRARS